jgi:ATP synthase protein I
VPAQSWCCIRPTIEHLRDKPCRASGVFTYNQGLFEVLVFDLRGLPKMTTTAPSPESEVEDSDFKPLTAEEAHQWRKRHPAVSIWRIVAGQALVGLIVSLLAWWFSGRVAVAWSAAYGALAVVMPAALFARGVSKQSAGAGAAMVRLFVWELAKLVLTVAMLALAPRVIKDLSWLALLAGMVVTMKTYWIALLVRSGVRKTEV